MKNLSFLALIAALVLLVTTRAAYGEDPAFYTFSKTLESYSTLGANTTLMIDAESDFFRFLESTTSP